MFFALWARLHRIQSKPDQAIGWIHDCHGVPVLVRPGNENI